MTDRMQAIITNDVLSCLLGLQPHGKPSLAQKCKSRQEWRLSAENWLRGQDLNLPPSDIVHFRVRQQVEPNRLQQRQAINRQMIGFYYGGACDYKNYLAHLTLEDLAVLTQRSH